MGDPLYAPLALSNLTRIYKKLGRDDLVQNTMRRIVALRHNEQLLLHPHSLATCYQRVGDIAKAREVLEEIRQISPGDPGTIAGLAELALFDKRAEEALGLSEPLRQGNNPSYQVLGRMLSAVSHLFMKQDAQAFAELSWIADFLIKGKKLPEFVWEYRDLLELVRTMTGTVSAVAVLTLQTLGGEVQVETFAQMWQQIGPKVAFKI